jgi:peroxiredoxin
VNHRFATCLLVLLGLLICSQSSLSDEADAVLGKVAKDFSLPDPYGREWRLADFERHEIVVVVFLGTECPLVKLYAPTLARLASDYADRSVGFIGVDSNQQDSLSELQHFGRSHALSFPLLKDPGNGVADQFGARRTPEVFVLDRDRKLRYRGRIDDQYTYGIQRPKAAQEYLVAALDQLLAGEAVARPETEPVGCHIGRLLKPQAGGDVTYARHISRILQDHCVACHRPGQIAPFALTDYDDVVGWAEMISEVVQEGRMPPWHADAPAGQFKNDRRLSEDQKQLIHRWVAGGAAMGDEQDLPPPKQFAEGWQIGEPDRVLLMSERPFRVPATGVVPYKYFVMDPGFDQDTWVKAAECRPGNREVVHHIIVGIRGEGEFRRQRRGGVHNGLESEWVAAAAPGAPPMVLPPGHAKLIPAGSQLVFQMHYTPNGTPQEDISRIGLVFAKPEDVTHRVLTLMALNTDFQIPSGADNHRVTAAYRFRQDVELLSLFPHMHLRGKSFRYVAYYPDGREETLLDVPRYDFNWQNGYEFMHAKPIPAQTKLQCIAHYDNSENNLANPDPTLTVEWGDQTWDEMMIGYFNVAVPVTDPSG